MTERLLIYSSTGSVALFSGTPEPSPVLYRDTNTGGSLSRSENGVLFSPCGNWARASSNWSAAQDARERFQGEPIECAGGVMNDLVADRRGRVYFAVTGDGLFYANPQGVVSHTVRESR
jgi:hypothetical protein